MQEQITALESNNANLHLQTESLKAGSRIQGRKLIHMAGLLATAHLEAEVAERKVCPFALPSASSGNNCPICSTQSPPKECTEAPGWRGAGEGQVGNGCQPRSHLDLRGRRKHRE